MEEAAHCSRKEQSKASFRSFAVPLTYTFAGLTSPTTMILIVLSKMSSECEDKGSRNHLAAEVVRRNVFWKKSFSDKLLSSVKN